MILLIKGISRVDKQQKVEQEKEAHQCHGEQEKPYLKAVIEFLSNLDKQADDQSLILLLSWTLFCLP
mgnify:CR=1 FL=1